MTSSQLNKSTESFCNWTIIQVVAKIEGAIFVSHSVYTVNFVLFNTKHCY